MVIFRVIRAGLSPNREARTLLELLVYLALARRRNQPGSGVLIKQSIHSYIYLLFITLEGILNLARRLDAAIAADF